MAGRARRATRSEPVSGAACRLPHRSRLHGAAVLFIALAGCASQAIAGQAALPGQLPSSDWANPAAELSWHPGWRNIEAYLQLEKTAPGLAEFC